MPHYARTWRGPSRKAVLLVWLPTVREPMSRKNPGSERLVAGAAVELLRELTVDGRRSGLHASLFVVFQWVVQESADRRVPQSAAGCDRQRAAHYLVSVARAHRWKIVGRSQARQSHGRLRARVGAYWRQVASVPNISSSCAGLKGHPKQLSEAWHASCMIHGWQFRGNLAARFIVKCFTSSTSWEHATLSAPRAP